IGIWSVGACIHAYCGIATAGVLTGNWFVSFERAKEILGTVGDVGRVVSVSVSLFVVARIVLAFGESGNFPAAIKATAEFFPKKDRGFATSIFNAGATVGALAAPLTIPFIAAAYGWEASFVIIGALGFVWRGFWIFMYKKPHEHPRVNAAELAYIQQDDVADKELLSAERAAMPRRKMSFGQAFKYRQTWAFAVGKFMTDGVWWFFLFWTPAYLSSVYDLDSTESAWHIFSLYTLTLLSIIGG